VSGVSETGFNERLLKEVTHSQHTSPLRQVGNVKGCALLPHDPEHIIPLACGEAPSHLKPVQFGQDGVLCRGHPHRACPRLLDVRLARCTSSLVKARRLSGIRSTLSMVPNPATPSPPRIVHQLYGSLTFATNRWGRNVANASGVSPSRNEQSSGCSH
jgi:hypothetical protein